ncbi:probable carboxylesterase 2 [Dioscorea cayenensis subsp. rotundata]|uniref:Probable carboxylesterase 2 n=1 Tax=Dioscorea cayennensis subsp. rotundata TaxID=55577 RepID=A0AB40CYR0_DIOCR|nr:probable carboxylesterase 2 [Dioscorea cayenensis subsp. rotundata]
MATNNEVVWEVPSYLRVYKDGHVERLAHPGPDFVPATYDPINEVSSKDIIIEPNTGVSARLYLPKRVENKPEKRFPVLVYYHGGGFFVGSAFSSWNQNNLNLLSSKANIIIVSVEYRLAPEHPLPTGYEDSWQALQWVISETNNDEAWLQNHADFGRVFVSGDSAGGNIAHHMVMRIGSSEGMKVIKGMVLVHPYFWGVERLECEIEKAGNESSKVLTVDSLDKIWPSVCPGTSGNDDDRINPFVDGAPSLAGLGCEKVMVCVAAKDLLSGRGKIYYEKLKSSGWKGIMVELLESHGEDHCFHLFNPGCDKALEMMKCLVGFFN